MVHESHISPDDYPTMLEHMLAPTLDQLAGRTALLDELAQSLWLTETAEILGLNYPPFLQRMCEHYAHACSYSDYATSIALALPYAEAMIATNPDGDKGREIRVYCRARLVPRDYAALLADYDWLARRPLRDLAYWTREIQNPDNTPEDNGFLADHYIQEDRYCRTHYCLASAWACYHLGDLRGAAEAFTRAFAEPGRDDFGFDPEWPVDLQPPVPDDDYLLWQVREQLRGRAFDAMPPAVQEWLGLACAPCHPLIAPNLAPIDGAVFLLSFLRTSSWTNATPKCASPSGTAFPLPTHSGGLSSRHTCPGCGCRPSLSTSALPRGWSTISGRAMPPGTCRRRSPPATRYA